MDSIIREMYFGDALPFWEQSIKATPHNDRLTALHLPLLVMHLCANSVRAVRFVWCNQTSCLQLFRHLAPKFLEIRQVFLRHFNTI